MGSSWSARPDAARGVLTLTGQDNERTLAAAQERWTTRCGLGCPLSLKTPNMGNPG